MEVSIQPKSIFRYSSHAATLTLLQLIPCCLLYWLGIPCFSSLLPRHPYGPHRCLELLSSFIQLTAERLAEAFTKAGLPKDILQVLHLPPDLVRHAIQHPKVNYISFTGSVAGGRDVDKTAAETGDFKTVGLEVSLQGLQGALYLTYIIAWRQRPCIRPPGC